MTVSMDVVQQRAIICFMMLQKKPKEIHEELVVTLGDDAFLYATAKK